MIHSGKKLKIEFFDKKLNGTFRGDYKFKTAIQLDDNKRLKLPTQLKKFVEKHKILSEHLKDPKNPIAMVELICESQNVTVLIDNRRK